ncbi:MAG TPA: acyl-CoA carboxylase subunit beta [Acidimicrobiia bacterium]|nr:acyl-CoA carboxylase subunit beta [Acidimicrobiia bacterium]
MKPDDLLTKLEQVRQSALNAGSDIAYERQHERGKLTARERIEKLVDSGTFVELDQLARHRATGFGIENTRPLTDGVITGWGYVEGRKVFLYSQDFAVLGGSLGQRVAEKIVKVMDLAASVGAPMIGINDGGGARIQEGVAALAGYGDIFQRNVKYSGVIPQISVIAGPCAGGAVYSPALTDFVLMVEGTSHMFITGPDVVKAVTGEQVTQEDLGGATTHSHKSGVANLVAADEEDLFIKLKELLRFLPANNGSNGGYKVDSESIIRGENLVESFSQEPQVTGQNILSVMSNDDSGIYDVRDVIDLIGDRDQFFEISEFFAPNIVCGFTRIDGKATGIVANQPSVYSGALDIDACEKAARFVRTCDAFDIPIFTIVDVAGFLPGVDQERSGIIRHGAKLLYAFAEATVPMVQLVTRRAYGGAFVVMGSKSLGADVSFALPTAEIAVMHAESAVEILSRRELEKFEKGSTEYDDRFKELVSDYNEKFANPFLAAERGLIDDVIAPSEARSHVIASFAMLEGKKSESIFRKHEVLPL